MLAATLLALAALQAGAPDSVAVTGEPSPYAIFGGRRLEAADLLARAYADEPGNAFVANEYARTLFWLDDRREESFAV